jgi:hypothetical protein
VRFICVDFGRSRRPRPVVPVVRATQNGAHRVARDTRFPRYLPNSLALSMQDLDLHLKFLCYHCEHVFASVQVGQFSIGGVGQFYSGANSRSISVSVKTLISVRNRFGRTISSGTRSIVPIAARCLRNKLVIPHTFR